MEDFQELPPKEPRGKRKMQHNSFTDSRIQSKKYISESQMIKHISKLRISDDHSDYETEESDDELAGTSFGGGGTSYVPEPGKLCDLSNAKKITIAEQFKSRLRADDDLFFARLFNKHTKSNACRSLVVWKPPPISVDNLLMSTPEEPEELSADVGRSENKPEIIAASLPTMEID